MAENHDPDVRTPTDTLDSDGGADGEDVINTRAKRTPNDDEAGGEGLFKDLLGGETIFATKDVLRPSYTPDKLPHRDAQITSMATILAAALRGEPPSNVLVYGKTGSGKTASARFISQELAAAADRTDIPCEVEYINCEVTDTRYRVLAQLANTWIETNTQWIDERLDTLQMRREEARACRRHHARRNRQTRRHRRRRCPVQPLAPQRRPRERSRFPHGDFERSQVHRLARSARAIEPL